MQIPSRFTLAIHTMLCIAEFSAQHKVTSTFIAKSTGANAVIIRRLLGQLKGQGLVDVRAGVGGASIVKPLEEITLFDIFQAVDVMQDEYFHVHSPCDCPCKLGKNIHTILDSHLKDIQEAMNQQMRKTTLRTLLDESAHYLENHP